MCGDSPGGPGSVPRPAVLAELRLQGWFPERGAGPGGGGNPWGLRCPRLPQQIPTSSPARLEHLNPSSRSCWTEERLCSLSGEVPGSCWGKTFPLPANGYWATAVPCLVPEVFRSHASPSTTCPAALQAGEIAQGSAPRGWLHTGSGSCQGSRCREQ